MPAPPPIRQPNTPRMHLWSGITACVLTTTVVLIAAVRHTAGLLTVPEDVRDTLLMGAGVSWVGLIAATCCNRLVDEIRDARRDIADLDTLLGQLPEGVTAFGDTRATDARVTAIRDLAATPHNGNGAVVSPMRKGDGLTTGNRH